MTSPTMPTPSTPRTLITWRDAKTERPTQDGWYLALLDEAFTAGTVRRVRSGVRFVGGQFTLDSYQTIIGWADVLAPSDIQTGEFVSVERVRGLDRIRITSKRFALEESRYGEYVRLSDIEQLGKGG